MRTIAATIALCTLTACGGCPPTTPDAGPDGPFGRVRARAVTGGFEVELVGLTRPIRAVQIPLTLSGAEATSASAAGTPLHDVVEAGLDTPKAAFTLVVADARGVPLDDGTIAFVATTGAGSVTFGDAEAVDELGAKQTLAADGAP